MHKGRIEAFSDGVIAIIITIMVLELKTPEGHQLSDLLVKLPLFFSYVLSFIYVAIYWNNHHHLFQVVKKIDGRVMWANMNLLFWLSLTPFVTAWIGHSHFALLPVICYGVILLMSSIAYAILVGSLLPLHEANSDLAKAIGKDTKGKLSTVLYLCGVVGSFINPWVGMAFYALVALIWLVPDRRIEKAA